MSAHRRHRFALQWWLTMGSATVFFVSLALVLAHVFGGREGFPLFLWVMVVTSIGDLVVALCYEAIAPTHVVVGAGERDSKSDPSREMAVAIDGFEQSETGRVRVRGEVWRARCLTVEEPRPRQGEVVQVVAREGLLLLVRCRGL